MKARCLVCLLPFLLISACTIVPAAQQARTGTPLQVTLRNDADELLLYHQSLTTLSRAEGLKEFDKLSVQPANAGGAVRKAMVLGLLGRKGDYAQALAQLQSVLADDSANAQPLKPLARVLATNYAAMQKLQEQLEKSERQLADNQGRIEQLTRMLDQLKAMERALPSRLGTPAAGS